MFKSSIKEVDNFISRENIVITGEQKDVLLPCIIDIKLASPFGPARKQPLRIRMK